jgi:hypothetical protein
VTAVDEMVLLPRVRLDRSTYMPDLIPLRVRSSSALLKRLRKVVHLPLADVACPLAITASARAAATATRISGCALENLEAFAVARAAAEVGVPFAAVLGVSNHVGPRGHRQWQQNAKLAAAAACDAVLAFFMSLAEEKPPSHGAHSMLQSAGSEPAAAARANSTSRARRTSGTIARVSSFAYIPR